MLPPPSPVTRLYSLPQNMLEAPLCFCSYLTQEGCSLWTGLRHRSDGFLFLSLIIWHGCGDLIRNVLVELPGYKEHNIPGHWMLCSYFLVGNNQWTTIIPRNHPSSPGSVSSSSSIRWGWHKQLFREVLIWTWENNAGVGGGPWTGYWKSCPWAGRFLNKSPGPKHYWNSLSFFVWLFCLMIGDLKAHLESTLAYFTNWQSPCYILGTQIHLVILSRIIN